MQNSKLDIKNFNRIKLVYLITRSKYFGRKLVKIYRKFKNPFRLKLDKIINLKNLNKSTSFERLRNKLYK